MLFLSGHHRRPSWGPVLPRAPCQLGCWVSSLPSPLTLAFSPLLCRGHLRPPRPDVAPPLTRCPLQPGRPASPAPALPPPWHPRQAFPALRPAPASPTAPLLAQGWPWDPGRRHCPGLCRRRGTWAPTRWAGTGSCPGWPSDSRARPRHVLPGTHTRREHTHRRSRKCGGFRKWTARPSLPLAATSPAPEAATSIVISGLGFSEVIFRSRSHASKPIFGVFKLTHLLLTSAGGGRSAHWCGRPSPTPPRLQALLVLGCVGFSPVQGRLAVLLR